MHRPRYSLPCAMLADVQQGPPAANDAMNPPGLIPWRMIARDDDHVAVLDREGHTLFISRRPIAEQVVTAANGWLDLVAQLDGYELLLRVLQRSLAPLRENPIVADCRRQIDAAIYPPGLRERD